MKNPVGLAAITNQLDVPEKSSAHWQQARVWDRWNEEQRPRVGPTYQAQRQNVARFIASLNGPLTVRELCCGTGRLASDLLDNPNVTRLYEVDISPPAIHRLLQQLQPHPRAAMMNAWVGNVMELPATANHRRFDVVICIDALPNLPWSTLPTLFQNLAAMLKPTGYFVGNYLSSENIDAHTANKHGRWGYWRIYGRLMLGKLLTQLRPAVAGQKGLLRTGTAYQANLQTLLAKSFTVQKIETGVYHWFVAAPNLIQSE